MLSFNRYGDNLLAAAFDAGAKRFCQRVANLDGESLGCAHISEKDESLTVEVPAPQRVEIPISFIPNGTYREVDARQARALRLSLISITGLPSEESARAEATQMHSVYASLFSELDEYLRVNGGYWVYLVRSPVEMSFNAFAGEYIVETSVHAVPRVSPGFERKAIPAFAKLRRWGTGDHAFIRAWDEENHTVVIHFFLG
jgi:hypothetical protein